MASKSSWFDFRRKTYLNPGGIRVACYVQNDYGMLQVIEGLAYFVIDYASQVLSNIVRYIRETTSVGYNIFVHIWRNCKQRQSIRGAAF